MNIHGGKSPQYRGQHLSKMSIAVCVALGNSWGLGVSEPWCKAKFLLTLETWCEDQGRLSTIQWLPSADAQLQMLSKCSLSSSLDLYCLSQIPATHILKFQTWKLLSIYVYSCLNINAHYIFYRTINHSKSSTLTSETPGSLCPNSYTFKHKNTQEDSNVFDHYISRALNFFLH